MVSFNQSIYGITIGNIGFFFIGILSTLIARHILLYIVKLKIIKLDDVVISSITDPLGYFILVQGLYISIMLLHLPDKIGGLETTSILYDAYVLIVSFIALYFVFRSIDILGLYISKHKKGRIGNLDAQLIPLIVKSLRIIVIIIGILSILNNFGYNIISLLTGLGIGGLALALAAQTTLSNLFGSITIFSDRHMRIGDLIKIGETNGTVEDVGLRTTLIRRADQALVTVPNSQFINTEVINYSAMRKRQIEFYLRIKYGTTAKKIKEVVDGIKKIIEEDEKIEQPSHIVRFSDFEESSLNIYIYCFTKTTNLAEFYAAKEELNLKIMELLEKLGIEIAVPSRTIYFEQNNIERKGKLKVKKKKNESNEMIKEKRL
jgi:MscS family membrane protein